MDHLVSVEAGWRPMGYSDADITPVRELAKAVRNSTGYRTWFHMGSKQLMFGFMSPNGPAVCWSIPMFREDGQPCRFRSPELYDADQVIWLLQMGKVSMKDKMRKQKALEERHAKEAAERRESYARAAGDLARDRFRSIGKISVPVNGRKGN